MAARHDQRKREQDLGRRRDPDEPPGWSRRNGPGRCDAIRRGAALAAIVFAPVGRAAAAELKVTRVALFNSGVGFFQAEGTVDGDATAELRFRTAQINDLIKSLVLQDLDGGTIRAVQYPTADPIDKALKSFGVDLTGRPTLGRLLDQLRGVPVEIAAPTAATGVIVGVEKKKVVADRVETEVEFLTILTDAGLRSFRLHELGGIRIRDEKVDGELRKALATLATSHDADRKAVTLNFSGRGRRRVMAQYMLEAPIWKTSYRLVLAEGKKPYLQGWATVENTTEEDWSDVRLSLVSGRPISFIMDLYTPLYVPRPKEELELYAGLRPPTYEGAMEKAEEQARMTDGNEARDRRLYSTGRQFARAARAAPQAVGGAAGLGVELDEAGVAPIATAERAGELFTYDIQTPVSLKRQQSALLPIVGGDIEGTKVSIFNPATHPKHPLNGLQLTNTTALNLMQGPVTVFDAHTYAGDAKLPDLRPGEKRLLSYALDLAVEMEQVAQSVPEEVVGLRIAKGTLWHRRKYVDARTYNAKNKDDKPRTVLIEQPFSGDWTLIEPKEPYERTPQVYRFKVEVPAGGKASLKVVLERSLDLATALSSTGLNDIHFYLRTRVISPALKRALEEVVSRRQAIDEVVRQRTQVEQQIAAIEQDQNRIRENLKALPGGSDVARRYLAKLDAQETELERLRAQAADLRRQEDAKRTDLERYLLSLDVE